MISKKGQLNIDLYDPFTGELMDDYDVNDIVIYDLARLEENIKLDDDFIHEAGAPEPGWIPPVATSSTWTVDYIPNIFVSPQEIGVDIIDKIRKINE